MNKQDKILAKSYVEKLVDFFWVYFDEKTAKMIRNHPERAIPMIREAVLEGKMGKAKITAHAEAMRTAVAHQALLSPPSPPPARVVYAI